jgi:hypothetical protein
MPTTTINLTGQALSKVDDTNVTLTLGGTPLTALLKATSLTLGWTGTLADARITSAATWNAKESALTFSTGLTRTVNTITIDNTVVTLTGAQALSNKTGNISQWTNDSGYLTSLAGAVTSVTGSGNIASSGGATPNITFTGVLPTANGGTAVNIATQILTTGAGITNESGAAVSRIRLSANNNIGKILSWATTGLARWAIRVDGNETGANAGGDIALRRYDDAGTFIDNVWSAVRSTGAFTFEKPFYGTSSLTLGTASSAAGSIILQNATNANTLTINSGVTSASYALTLPTAQGGASTYLQNDGTGVLSWAAVASGASLSGLTAASATNTINNVNYAQVWRWNSLTTEIGLTLSSSSISTGSINKIISTSTVGNAAKGLEINISGANSTASKTVYGIYSSVINTGTTSTNVSGCFSASGATTNYAIQVNVGSLYMTPFSGTVTRPPASGNGGSHPIFMGIYSSLQEGGGGFASTILGNNVSTSGSAQTLVANATDLTAWIKMTYNTGISFHRGSGTAGVAVNETANQIMLINGTGVYIGATGTTPTASLHIKAGTATASTAPLKFTSGTNLTTPENGAFEYNGTNLFFTRAGAVREGVVTQSAVTTEVVVSDTTVTVNIGGVTYKLLAKA